MITFMCLILFNRQVLVLLSKPGKARREGSKEYRILMFSTRKGPSERPSKHLSVVDMTYPEPPSGTG